MRPRVQRRRAPGRPHADLPAPDDGAARGRCTYSVAADCEVCVRCSLTSDMLLLWFARLCTNPRRRRAKSRRATDRNRPNASARPTTRRMRLTRRRTRARRATMATAHSPPAAPTATAGGRSPACGDATPVMRAVPARQRDQHLLTPTASTLRLPRPISQPTRTRPTFAHRCCRRQRPTCWQCACSSATRQECATRRELGAQRPTSG